MDGMEDINSFDGDISIKAGAGSGKTRALVGRYISELERPRDGGRAGVDRLVAITFTDKAAAEMSDRVRQELTRKIEQLREKTKMKGSSANIGEDDPAWKEDEVLAAHLVRQRQALPNAHISTIHSFCARILWENHLAAGVDPSFAVIDETAAAELLETTVRNVTLGLLRSGDAGARKLARDFGYSAMSQFSKGLREYVLWLVPLMRAGAMAPADLAGKQRELLEKLRQDAATARRETPGAFEALSEFKKNSKEYKTWEYLDGAPELLGESDAVDIAVAGEALEMADELEKAVYKRKKYRDGSDPCAEALRAADVLRRICLPVIEEGLAGDMEAFTKLVAAVMAEYGREKTARAALDFSDLQEKTLALFRRSPETLERYNKKFRKLLIDEFQDTDDLQSEIIGLLAPPGEGRLFIVGDVKQSIYGFRGANIAVFERMTESIARNGGRVFYLRKSGRATPKLTGFFNGLFAELMSGEDGGMRFSPDEDALEALRMGDGIDSSVERVYVRGGPIAVNRRLEAEAIARRVRDGVGSVMVEDMDTGKPRPARYGDYAVLLRTLSSHEVYESALRRAGVPFMVVKGRGFYDSQEIKDLVNLLSFLDYTADRLALVSVLRSPLVGISDAGLLALCVGENGKPRDPSVFFTGGADAPPGLDDEDRDRFEAFRTRAQRWRRAKDRFMISELLEAILSETGYGAVMMSRFNGEQMLANTFKLIELARTYERDGAQGLKNFTSRLRRLIATAPGEAKADVTGGGDDVVKIMTVHQSKGLEFPVVFLPDLGFSARNHSGRMAFHHDVGVGMKAWDMPADKWYSGAMHRLAQDVEKKAREDETKRLLYVGVTRARDILVMTGPAEANGEWRKWIDAAIEAGAVEVESYEVTGEPGGLGIPVEEEAEPAVARALLGSARPEPGGAEEPERAAGAQAKPSLQVRVTALAAFSQCPRLYYYRNVMEMSGAGGAKTFEKAGGRTWTGARMGSMLHEALETVPLGVGAGVGEVDRAVAAAFAGYPERVTARMRADVRRAFSAEPLAGLFCVAPEAILREVPMVHRIVMKDIDMTVTGTADVIWFDGEGWRLADYKLSRRPGDERHYVFQLKLYAYTLMSARDMERLDAAVVYLREERKIASAVRFLPGDAQELKERIAGMGRKLARLEGKPGEQWPVREKKFCRGAGCAFLKRCYG